MHVLRLVPREHRDGALDLLRRVVGGEVIEDLDGKRLTRDGRSQSIAMPENIDVKSTVIPMTPGAMNWR